MERICQREFNAQDLVTSFPPRLGDRNKEIAFGMSSPAGATGFGSVSCSCSVVLGLAKIRARR